MESNLKTIITIAVRMKSSRLPQKAMQDIAGKPLIEYLIRRVQSSKKAGAVVLCTSHLGEDAVLLDVAQKCGVSWIAGDPDDVFQRFLEAASRENAGHVVRVTGDNPLTDPLYMDRLIEKHVSEENEYTTVEGLPLGTASEVISVPAMKKARSLLEDPSKSEYMTFLLKDPSRYKIGLLRAEEAVFRPEYRLTVDTVEDLNLMRQIFQMLSSGSDFFPLAKVVALIDSNPKLAWLNREVRQRGLEVL